MIRKYLIELLEDAISDFLEWSWKRKADKGDASGGGGVISIMNGRIFEKVGVNISTVIGTFSE